MILLLRGDTWNPFPLHIFASTLFLMVKHHLTSKMLESYYIHFCQRPSPIIPSPTTSSDLERTAAVEFLKDASTLFTSLLIISLINGVSFKLLFRGYLAVGFMTLRGTCMLASSFF